MKLSVPRFSIITVLLFTLTLVTFQSLSVLALAQEPPSFEIAIIPQADYATAGQLFTYTVTITNVSQTPLQNIFIKIPVPNNTTFINTHHPSLKWYGGNPNADPKIQVEQVTMFTPDFVEAGEIFTFDMIVKVSPETNQQIVMANYEVGAANDAPPTSGPAIKTPVLVPTPTPSPVPSFTPVVTSASLDSNPTTESGTTVAVLTLTATPATLADLKPTSTSVPVTLEAPVAQNRASESSSFVTGLIIIGSIFILVIIGIIWFLRKKL